jgi:hypothetical protein
MLLQHCMFRFSVVNNANIDVGVDGRIILKWILTLYCWVTYNEMIAMPCIVDGSRILAFSYRTSYTCVCGLFFFKRLLSVAFLLKLFHISRMSQDTPFLLQAAVASSENTLFSV